MRFPYVPRSFFVLVALSMAQSVALRGAVEIPPREQVANDTSEYRRFVLDNGVKVILLSDPKLNKSSAAMAVDVGSLSDPADRPGLAHFLEHMLFLGTKKYPDEREYRNYLQSNGGYSNAYTAANCTNYFFEIRHEAFEGAIDRFAQFFIAPLFLPEFTEREMNAVNSENQKNLENDTWRTMQLGNSLYRAGHPANHFSTGNRETLAGTTQDELLAFYRKHYSANRMTLALTGKASLDELEAWVRKYFAEVENRKLEKLRFPVDYLPPEPALRIARMEPIKDLRELNLEFPLFALQGLWAGKPSELIDYIIGYEGEGSLLSALKSEGLATGLNAGSQAPTADYGSFDVSIALTPVGLEKTQRVLELFFATIETMRRAEYPAYIFKERQKMAQLDELYSDKGDGADRARDLANQIREFPLEVAERERYLWVHEDPENYKRILAQVRPDNMLAILVAKGVKTDSAEKYYGTKYSYEKDTGAAYNALLHPPTVATIHLPKPDTFVPAHVALLAAQPVHLINEPALSLYYAQDTEFLRPMVSQIYRFRLPRSRGTLDDSVMLRFYEACVNESLNEVAYPAKVAGLDFSLTAEVEGVKLSISGYNESAAKLLDVITGSLVNFTLPPERFAAVKDRIVRGLRNFPRGDAWQIVLQTRRVAVREFYYRPDEQLPVAEKVTLEGVQNYARSLYAKGKIEALIHGNVSADEAIASARRVGTTFKVAAIPDNELLRRRLLVQKSGETFLSSEQLAVNNSTFRRDYVLGGDDPEMRAAALVFTNFISDPFFGEMRTRQQLGYIVFGGAGEEERTSYAYFIIQSGDHPADEVEKRADAFIAQFPGMLAALPEEAWEMIREGVRSQLEEKDKTIAERSGRLFTLAYDYAGDWGRREATLAALDKLTKARAQQILAAGLDPATRQMRTFLGFAREHKPAGEIKATFANPQVWKKTQSYR